MKHEKPQGAQAGPEATKQESNAAQSAAGGAEETKVTTTLERDKKTGELKPGAAKKRSTKKAAAKKATPAKAAKPKAEAKPKKEGRVTLKAAMLMVLNGTPRSVESMAKSILDRGLWKPHRKGMSAEAALALAAYEIRVRAKEHKEFKVNADDMVSRAAAK